MIQIEHYKNKVSDKYWLLGGTQSITTPLGMDFPLVFKNELCYLHQHYPTDHEMITLPQVIMTLDEEWDPTIYTTTVLMDEQLQSLLLIPKGTCDDDYENEGNLVLNVEIMVTTVNDDSNTISNHQEDVNSLDNNNDDSRTFSDVISLSDILLGFDCIGSGNSSELTRSSESDSSESSSTSQHFCQQSHFQQHCKHCKYYREPTLPSHPPCTNKHKQRHHRIHLHFSVHDDNVSIPGIQIPVDDDNIIIEVVAPQFHHPVTLPITQSNYDLPYVVYNSVLQDDTNGDFFYDALEEVDTTLDAYVTVGDYTFSIKDPSSSFFLLNEGTAEAHGGHIYNHVSGAYIKVCVLESEDDGSLPSDHTFWMSYFSNNNLS